MVAIHSLLPFVQRFFMKKIFRVHDVRCGMDSSRTIDFQTRDVRAIVQREIVIIIWQMDDAVLDERLVFPVMYKVFVDRFYHEITAA